jgi:DeoR family transcriptional regulator of aga operon
VFLGTHLIDDQGDLADVSIEVANLKRAMVRAARQVILLADSTKWSLRRPAKAKVAPLGAVHIVVTDNGIDPDTRRSIEAQGIEVVVV